MTGDEASRLIRPLYVSWYSSLVRYGYRICGSVEAAEDAVQEAFQSLYLALIEGTDVVDAKRWTLCVVRRAIGKHHRSQIRHGEQLMAVTDLDEMPDPRPASLDENIEWDELTELFAALTSREQEVLLLRMNGLRYQEIADDLEISHNSVKTLLARALKKLRSSLSSPEYRGRISNARGLGKTLH